MSVYVVMTASGRVRESSAESVLDVLEEVCEASLTAGRAWDEPSKLFVDGKCIVESGLADVAAEYSAFREAKEDEMLAACEAWVAERYGAEVAMREAA